MPVKRLTKNCIQLSEEPLETSCHKSGNDWRNVSLASGLIGAGVFASYTLYPESP